MKWVTFDGWFCVANERWGKDNFVLNFLFSKDSFVVEVVVVVLNCCKSRHTTHTHNQAQKTTIMFIFLNH